MSALLRGLTPPISSSNYARSPPVPQRKTRPVYHNPLSVATRTADFWSFAGGGRAKAAGTTETTGGAGIAETTGTTETAQRALPAQAPSRLSRRSWWSRLKASGSEAAKCLPSHRLVL